MLHHAIDTGSNHNDIDAGKLSYEDTPSMQSDQNLMDGSTKPRSIMTLHDLPPRLCLFGK